MAEATLRGSPKDQVWAVHKFCTHVVKKRLH